MLALEEGHVETGTDVPAESSCDELAADGFGMFDVVAETSADVLAEVRSVLAKARSDVLAKARSDVLASAESTALDILAKSISDELASADVLGSAKSDSVELAAKSSSALIVRRSAGEVLRGGGVREVEGDSAGVESFRRLNGVSIVAFCSR
jgi:hypothetical protein